MAEYSRFYHNIENQLVFYDCIIEQLKNPQEMQKNNFF